MLNTPSKKVNRVSGQKTTTAQSNMTTSFLSREHTALIQRSRDKDLLWVVKHHIKETRVSPFEAVFRKFFLSALEKGDMDAILTCRTMYAEHDTENKLPAWECATCGCADRMDFYGDRMCGCDSCHNGCESSESKIARGCKRSRDEHEAGLACSIVADMLETMLNEYEFDDVLTFLHTVVVPPSMAEIFDGAFESLIAMTPNKDTNICELAHKLNVYHRAYGYICLGAR